MSEQDREIVDSVEAVLFSTGKGISVREISRLVRADENKTREALDALMKEYESRHTALMIVEESDKWKMCVRENYTDIVSKILPEAELSRGIMQTLAYIAWKVPITQAEVVKVRSTKAYSHISELERMGFLTKERKGRTYLLKLGQKFYTYFDVKTTEEIKEKFKDIEEYREQIQETVEQMKSEEETAEEPGFDEMSETQSVSEHTEKFAKQISGVPETRSVSEDAQEPKVLDKTEDIKSDETEVLDNLKSREKPIDESGESEEAVEESSEDSTESKEMNSYEVEEIDESTESEDSAEETSEESTEEPITEN